MGKTFLQLIRKDRFLEESNPKVLNRGKMYYRSGKVELINLTETNVHLHVQGRQQYCVDISKEAGYIGYDCQCPAYDGWGICKHLVASLLYLQDIEEELDEENKWQTTLEATLRTAQFYPAKGRRKKQTNFLVLSMQSNYFDSFELIPYAFKASVLPAEMLEEVVNDPSKLATVILALKKKGVTLNAKKIDYSNYHSSGFINVPEILHNTLKLASSTYNYYRSTFMPQLEILSQFDVPFFMGDSQTPFKKLLTISETFAKIELNLEAADTHLDFSLIANIDDLVVNLHEHDTVELIDGDDVWLLADENLVKLDEVYHPYVLKQLIDGGSLQIPFEQRSFFINNYLIPLLGYFSLRGTAVSRTTLNEPITNKELLLEEEDGQLFVSLNFRYDTTSLPYDSEYPHWTTNIDELASNDNEITLVEIKRMPDEEEEIYRSLSAARYGLKYAAKGAEQADFVLRSSVDPVDFLLNKVPNLIADGFDIFGEEKIKSARVNRHQPTISFNVSSGIDWFDIQAVVQFGDVGVDLKEVRKSLRSKQRIVKLADGSIGEIPEEWVQKYRHIFHLGEQEGENIRLSNHHFGLLDKLLAEADQTQVDAQYQQRLERLKNFSGIDKRPLPSGLVGELRPYQKAGYDWLHFLNEFQFGGCLADDMGLGKTVQVLTLLQSLHAKDNTLPPNLIVLPRSLIVNWEREAEKFTPDLKVLIYFGPERHTNWESITNYDLILTTYGIVRQDIKKIREFNFHYIILDESQAIKNPNAKISKSVRLLKSKHRLVMTGTPVENSTFELWSQFAFLNPGLLGGVDYFRKAFSNPIERNQDKEATELLRQMVYPFIMRRTKTQVALDLPPRTDRVLYVEMSPAQRKFYNKTRDDYRAQLLGLIQEQGINSARFKVLEGLLRLRQICNHPKLVNPQFRGDSGKLELLLETIDNLNQEGHKALIFSQFVKTLQLIQTDMKKLKIPYTYLDGQTRKRQEQVDTFQTDPNIRFFLISLKAGGVGLNLTAADYVIHVDPWWNPAVEMQASDRSHRIGQDKPVFVYKLITKDSVEEKILQLQERKKALVEQLITSENKFLKQLTADDVQVLFS